MGICGRDRYAFRNRNKYPSFYPENDNLGKTRKYKKYIDETTKKSEDRISEDLVKTNRIKKRKDENKNSLNFYDFFYIFSFIYVEKAYKS